MSVVGRLKEGNLLIKSQIDERIPALKSGLIHYFPLDGNGGAWDIVGGVQTHQNVSSGVNMIEGMHSDWRNPESWSSNSGMIWDEKMQAMKITGYHNSWLKTPIVIDPTRTYELMYEIYIEERSVYNGGTGRLYLGGLSNNKRGQRVTRNYDYTMASGTIPPLKEWTTYKLTRTGTEIARSGTTQSYDTIKGWQGDTVSESITDRIIKYYHMGGLFNYSGSGVMYIRQMSIRVTDSDISNTIPEPQGLGISQSTKNYLGDGVSGRHAFDISGWTGNGSFEVVGYSEHDTPIFRYNTKDSSYRYTIDHVLNDDLAELSGNDVTFSLYLRRVEGPARARIRVYDNVSGYSYYPIDVTDEFQHYQATKKVGTSPTRMFVMIDTNGGGTYEFYSTQLEKSDYAKGFTKTTRSTSKVSFESEIGMSNFTVAGQFIPDANSDKLPNGINFLDLGHSIKLSTYNGRPYLHGSAITGGTSSNIHSKFTATPGDRVYYSVRREGSKLHWTMKSDNGEYASLMLNHENIKISNIGDITLNGQWGGVHKNLAIYNRALSDEELMKLENPSVQIKKTGDLVSELYENDGGWRLVWEGLAPQMGIKQYDSKHTKIDDYGNHVVFNQMKVVAPYWEYEVEASTTKTAVLKESMTHYTAWLRNQPDAESPGILFHGEDDVQDVGFTQRTSLMFGYGNSWRRITPVHYISGTLNYMYLGGTPSYIHHKQWEGADGDDYQHNMDSDEVRETGTYKLTPREFNTIQIWVRMKKDDSLQMRHKKEVVRLNKEIKEGSEL